jgi:flavin reductase (DIM6/NTAB) family NADH-FMN oxidoreductase RutF
MASTNVRCLHTDSLLPAFPPVRGEADEAPIRAATSQVASGVAVATWGIGEARGGLTTASVSPLPAEPATLVVTFNRASSAYAAFARANRFAVNVLGGDQREIAEHFSGLSEAANAGPFEVGRWVPLSDGLCCLADCAAVFECEAEETIGWRTGAIVIARVRRAFIGGGSGALVRWRGAYDQLGWSRDEICRAVGLAPGGRAWGEV